MYIVYNNVLFDFLDKNDSYKLITYKIDKTDKNFYKNGNVSVSIIDTADPNIQDIYDVDFYVVYHDNSKSTENDDIELWNVNEGRCMHEAPDILKDEVGLILLHLSKSEDWVDCDRSSCSKIVKLEECEKYEVVYTYKVKNGEKLEEFIKESVEMTKEEFKNEMIKYRWTNM